MVSAHSWSREDLPTRCLKSSLTQKGQELKPMNRGAASRRSIEAQFKVKKRNH